jgi:hypothetical protein
VVKIHSDNGSSRGEAQEKGDETIPVFFMLAALRYKHGQYTNANKAGGFYGN